ncbi:hypothetical protein LINPERHAP2_LOCUS29017, partial [Linum perenne]
MKERLLPRDERPPASDDGGEEEARRRYKGIETAARRSGGTRRTCKEDINPEGRRPRRRG